MGIDTRLSYGLRQLSYQSSKQPVSPSSLPDTSSQTSTLQYSTSSWQQSAQHCPQREGLAVPPEQRQHPRRSTSTVQKVPSLVRQDERKVSFVDSLVGKSALSIISRPDSLTAIPTDSATQMVEVIWPLSVAPPPCRPNTSGVLSLRRYIEETLRRSRTSYSTLQVALYYLVLIMPFVPKCDFTKEQHSDSAAMRSLQCGRRMFLAALILASKYLQDRNYSTKAWSKMSGLKATEINMNERAFLECVNWKLHIPDNIFKRWTDVVLRFTPSQFPPPPGQSFSCEGAKLSWRDVIPTLTPELDMVPHTAEQVVAASPEPSPMQTPFASLPSFLEPQTDVVPPTPAFAGTVASLPTPRSTPPRTYTPAVSVASVDSWSSVGRAPLSRRASASSTDSGSYRSCSPDSSCSDITRLSRSSSISSVSTSVTSVSSQPSVSAQAYHARPAVCRSSKTYPQMPLSHQHQPVIVVNDDLLASSPLSIFYNENSAFPAEDAQPLQASRAPKRKFSEREDQGVESMLQYNVREALREQHGSAVPVVKDDVLAHPGCGLHYNVQQMLGTPSSQKRRCLSVSVAAH